MLRSQGSSWPKQPLVDWAAPSRKQRRRPRRIELCGLPLTTGLSTAQAVTEAFAAAERQEVVLSTFINPHAYFIAGQSRSYARNLRAFDYVLPDGVGIIWALRLLRGIHTERLSFDSTALAFPVLGKARDLDKSVMLIGGGSGVAGKAAQRLTTAVPGLRVVAALDGYQSYRAYERIVRATQPDVILCGMGAPHQEALLVQLRQAGIWTGLGYTCGGYLDQLQDNVQYYPEIVDRLDIRWLYRLTKEPRRLFRRYGIEYQQFCMVLARELLRRHRGV